MQIDIFDTENAGQDRVFRYPLYERFLWLVVIVAGALALVFLRQISEFIQTEGRRALVVIAVVAFFLLLTVWMSIRAWLSKVIISPVSLKARVFGQGIQRVSWVHIQQVLYKWRPLGHKLVFIGSDGARITFRSSITGYHQLLSFIRESCPEHVTDQLDELLGEEENEFDDDTEPEEPEADAERKPDEKPADAKPAQQPPPVPEKDDDLDDEEDEEEEEDDEDSDEEESDADEDEDEDDEEEDQGRKRRHWWWPFGR